MNKDFDSLLESLFLEEVSRKNLDNGLIILAKEDQSAEVVSVQVWVKTGSIHEAQYLGSGISHYLEHMLFKGTSKRTYKQISADIQTVGGNVNAYTTFDRTVYYIDGPSQSLETALDVLSDITFNSIIDPHETQKEQSVILREIDMGLDDPDRQLSENLFKTVFREHPYRYPIIGEKPLFTKLTHEHLLSYYKTRYTPNNITLVIVGAHSIDHIFKLAETYFSKNEPRSLQPVFIPQEPPQLSRRNFYFTGDYEIVRGAMTFSTPGLSHPDSPALAILANILGQGQSSHLWQRLREDSKQVHTIGASLWNPASSGLFFISYTCDPGKRLQVENAIHSEINAFFKTEITKETVQKAIRQAIVGEINSRKTMSGQASRIGIAEVVVGDIHYPRIFIENLKKVSVDQLQELQKKYFFFRTLTQAALEPSLAKKVSKKKAEKSTLPDFQITALPNGIRIIHQLHSNVPKVHIRLGMLGGAIYETPEVRGVTGVLSTMLTKDTQKRSSLEVAKSIENIGGSFSEFVGNNTYGLHIEVLPNDLELASDLLKEALLSPNFKQKQFEIERDSQIADIKEDLDDLLSRGIRDLREIFFGNHPYRNDALGTIEALEKLDLQKLKEHHQKLLNPENLVIAVSGQFDPQQTINLLSDWAQNIPKTSFPSVVPPKFTAPLASGTIEKEMDKEQVVVFEAYLGVGVKDPQHEIADILDELFSGMSSNLFEQVREEKGMAYYIGSSRIIGINTGMFYFYGGTSTQNYLHVFDEIEKEIKRIQSGNFSDEEIYRCKIRLKSVHLMGLQIPAFRANQALLDTLYSYPPNHWRTYPTRIEAVSKQAIQNFAKQHFDQSRRVRFAIGKIK